MKKFFSKNSWLLFGLSFFLFISLITLSNSKFQVALGSADDLTRVAHFLGDGDLVQEVAATELAPGEQQPIELMISNIKGNEETEVSMQFTVMLDSYGSLPFSYQLYKIENETAILVEGFSETLTYTEELPPGSLEARTLNFRLDVTWPEEANQLSYSNDLKITRLLLEVEQID